MSLSLEMVTVDCTDPRRLAQWWAEAVGGATVDLPGTDFVLVAREGWPALGFQRADDPTPGKNRVHLDIDVTDGRSAPLADRQRQVDTEVRRLEELGARVLGSHAPEGADYYAVTMADPEGNEFCLS